VRRLGDRQRRFLLEHLEQSGKVRGAMFG